MQIKFLKFFIATVLFSSFNFKVFSQQEAIFETITQAITCEEVNRAEVRKLVITGEISGNDYSPDSHWALFIDLDLYFESLEEVEIHTHQDIPDVSRFYDDCDCGKGPDVCYYCRHGIFLYSQGLFRQSDLNGILLKDSPWLKKFSAPNVKKIGLGALSRIENLVSVSFPLVVEVGVSAFSRCISLVYVDFPELVTINTGSFSSCSSLVSVNFPKVTTIESSAFRDCMNLISIDFPNATKIFLWAFVGTPLVSIDFPRITKIEAYTFRECHFLRTVSLGTDLEEETEDFTSNIFHSVDTRRIDLTLGENVNPKPDIPNRIWNFNIVFPNNRIDSYWRSINIKYINIEEEIEDTDISVLYVGKNIYYINSENVQEVELYDITGRKIHDFGNEKIIDLNYLPASVYFLKWSVDKITKTKKLIKYQ